MANDIRISGTELQWRNSSNTVFSTEGITISGSGTNRSLRMTGGNNLEYIDNTGQARRCVLQQDGTVSSDAQERSLYIDGDDLVVIGTPSGSLDPRPKYIVQTGSVPSEVPTDLSITMPWMATFHPWDARVTWTNTSSQWQIRVRWLRNGNIVQNVLLSANTTGHTTDDTYFDNGDQVEVRLSYENAFGEGDSVSEFETA